MPGEARPVRLNYLENSESRSLCRAAEFKTGHTGRRVESRYKYTLITRITYRPCRPSPAGEATAAIASAAGRRCRRLPRQGGRKAMVRWRGGQQQHRQRELRIVRAEKKLLGRRIPGSESAAQAGFESHTGGGGMMARARRRRGAARTDAQAERGPCERSGRPCRRRAAEPSTHPPPPCARHTQRAAAEPARAQHRPARSPPASCRPRQCRPGPGPAD
jgi:hypothetical protein